MFTALENDPIWRNVQCFFSHHLYDHKRWHNPPKDPRLCGCGCVFVPTLQKRFFSKVRFMYSSMEPRVMACVLIVVTSWSHLREEHITTWWGNSGVLLTEGPFPRHPGISRHTLRGSVWMNPQTPPEIRPSGGPNTSCQGIWGIL